MADRKTATRRELADAGVRVIGKPKNFPWSSVEARITELTSPDGALFTREEHGSCPGHAAFIDDTGEAVLVCQHPKDWNHGTPAGYAHRSKAEDPGRRRSRPARRQQDEALKVADEARASFLHDYLSRKGRPAAGTLRTALTVLAAREMHYGSTRVGRGMATDDLSRAVWALALWALAPRAVFDREADEWARIVGQLSAGRARAIRSAACNLLPWRDGSVDPRAASLLALAPAPGMSDLAPRPERKLESPEPESVASVARRAKWFKVDAAAIYR